MVFSLSQLNTLVKEVIEESLCGAYWLQAEIASITDKGHCYLELIEKDEHTNTPIARARATCWSSRWTVIRQEFLMQTGTVPRAGMKVLLQVKPTFHQAYSFAWNIIDIDPTYTVGDMQRRREEIVRKLKEEGIFELQKELELLPFAQRIAVISSADAAGYGDFRHHLYSNSRGLAFYTRLYPAVMQGESVEASVISALMNIYEEADVFDCVVIIRGGGATSDLSGFDSLPLAEHIAQFPIPVITGIGHERDNSVIDLISHTRVKTPTAAAAFLIDHLEDTLDTILLAQEKIQRVCTNVISEQQRLLTSLSARIPVLFSLAATKEQTRLDYIYNKVRELVAQRITRQKHQLQLLEQRADSLNPDLLLARGYSMTFIGDRLLTSVSQLTPGCTIRTRLKDGEFVSTPMAQQQQ